MQPVPVAHKRITVRQLAERLEQYQQSMMEKINAMASEFDQLTTDVQSDSDAVTALQAAATKAFADIQAEIDQLKKLQPSIAPQLAQLEQVVAQHKALAAQVQAADPGTPTG